MSISPPSDIVLDVARAADPDRYRVAAARLTSLAPSGGAEFADALDTAATETSTRPTATIARPTNTKIPASAAKAFQSFESMTLATFIEAALPDNADDVFGSGTAGSVWKSMLAEQIADQMAKRGGVGIADQLAKSVHLALNDKNGEAASPMVAPALLDTAERGFLRAIAPDQNSDDGSSQ